MSNEKTAQAAKNNTQGAGLRFAFSHQSVFTKAAEAAANEVITLARLQELCATPPKEFFELRAAYMDAIECGDVTAKERAQAIKRKLPYFIPGGVCERHHSDATLQYNGVVQGDFDYKEQRGFGVCMSRRIQIEEAHKRGAFPYLAFVGVSPSGYGLKLLFATTATETKDHKGAAAAVIAEFRRELEVECIYLPDGGKWDVLGASQPCYLPYGECLYFAPESKIKPYQYSPKPTTRPRTYQAEVTDAEREYYREAAAFLVDNRVELAAQYGEYLPCLGACISAFGHDEGAAIAYDILRHSPAFMRSNFERNFRHKAKSLRIAYAPAGWLISKARAAGWHGSLRQEIDPAERLHGAAGAKFTDVLKAYGIDLTPTAFCGFRWVVPTGAGKTYAVSEFTKSGARGVIVCPTIALVHNVAAEYGASIYDGTNKYIPIGARFIATTYKSLPNLVHKLNYHGGAGGWHLFLDEAHNVVSSASRGFMYQEIQAILTTAPQFASFTTLTGTDIYSSQPGLLAMPKRAVLIPNTIEKQVSIIRADSVREAVIQGTTRAIAAGRKVVILWNNKGGKLASLAARVEAIPGAKVAYYNADTKQTAEFLELCESSKLPGGVNVVITTTVLKEGNNINDPGGFDFIITGRHHHTAIEQITARARRAGNIRVTIIKGRTKPEKAEAIARAGRFCPAIERKRIQDESAQAVQMLNNCKTDSAQVNSAVFEALRVFRNTVVGVCPIEIDESGTATVSPLLVDNAVYDAQARAEYANDELQARELARFGFIECGSAVLSIEADREADREAGVTEATAQARETKQQQYENALANCESMTAAEIHKSAGSKAHRPGAAIAYKTMSEAIQEGVTPEQARELVTRYAPKASKKEGKQLGARLLMHRLSTAKALQSHPIIKSIQAVQAAFAHGETCDIATITERVKSATAGVIPAHYFDIERGDRVLSLARLFFEVISTTRREGCKHRRGYKFVNLVLPTLSKEITQNCVYKIDPDFGVMLTAAGYPAMWDAA